MYLSDFPVLQVDVTSITEEGFKGPDTIEIVRGLFETADPTGIGIVFMEELSDSIGYRVEVTDDLREQLWKQANGKYGCRMLENTLVDQAMSILPTLLVEETSAQNAVVVLDKNGQSRVGKPGTTKKTVDIDELPFV